jgi:hypothetical protein
MSLPQNNLEENRKKIAAIVKENPAVTHINFRRDDEQLVDIPLGQADFIARQYPMWTVEDGGLPSIDVVVARGAELPVIEVPPKPSEEAAAASAAMTPAAAAPAPLEELPPVTVAKPAPLDPPAPTPEPPKPAARKRATRR